MKAIIIAAGMGSRLNSLTNGRPKCMLELSGKTLLQHQIETLKDAGIDRIALIKGYKKEMINYPDLIYYVNGNYQHNNILHSLFYAEKEMKGEFIAVYSDILYESEIVKKLCNDKSDISIAVDIDWRGYYKNRTEHPIDEAENVIFDKEKNVVKIGKALPDKDIVNGEFIGMLRCSKNGSIIFKKHFQKLKKICTGKPFQSASVFEEAYLTDMIQDLADSDISVHCVTIKGGWREIDTAEDYQRLLRDYSRA